MNKLLFGDNLNHNSSHMQEGEKLWKGIRLIR